MKPTRKFPLPIRLTATFAAVALLAGSAFAQEKKEAAVPAAADADASSSTGAVAIMQRASDYLAKAQQLSVKAETCQELFADNGMKVQFTKQVEIRLRRPDRLWVSIATNAPKRSLWYDGKSITMLDHRQNFYGKAPAPGKVDAMVSEVEKALGVVFPLDDLVLSKPFIDAAASAKSSLYLGLTQVLGKRCHHVAFQHEAIDWQAWVEDGPKPVLRKLVITYKLDEGAPQFTAHFTDWDTGTKLADFLFAFEPPPGATEIKVLPSTADAKAGSGTKTQE